MRGIFVPVFHRAPQRTINTEPDPLEWAFEDTS
ncbi:hypothetical protein Q457_17055 [Escherichia coli ATCC BAA-2196]|nr:hypothetical protein FORC28_2414 [Escherichia coli]ERA59091.1 hypothetical protein L668_08990 [Escherichia coli 95NR1]ERE05372.1 hypothetical protein L667_25955 [Escherichia coli 95JB1]ETD57127.1 hypothetical protein Q459_11620 [Escherichia coli ATCC BAA-2215]ETD64821.1 hypothetical protein Q458_04745 [Escherichia coli ATCC BAA-2209]ETI75343.1 hypothetical protein Q457_17055 [Escherichia coli ATCC BAA-2196]ETI78553.1 hypothetical protein Q460_08300 [Escherichia coli ATCC BAA-2219]ETJ58855